MKLTVSQPTFYKKGVINSFVVFGLAVATIFGAAININCGKPTPAQTERERKESEAELLAKLPNLKSMSDIERYRLFDELKKVGSEATIRALIPLLEASSFQDKYVYSVMRVLKTIAKPHLHLLLEAILEGGYYKTKNTLEVIGDMEMDTFEKLKILLGFYTWEKRAPIFEADGEIKELLNGKIDARVLALINEIYDKTSGEGKYSLLGIVGDIQDTGVVQLLTRALYDPNPKDASIRKRAAQRLRAHKPLPPETIDAIWQRLEEERDPDTVFELLILLRDNNEIPTEACDWEGSKGITRASGGTLQLQRNEGLNCTIPKRPRPPSERD